MAIWIVRGGSRWDDAEQDFLKRGSVGIYFGVDRDINTMSDAALRLAPIHRRDERRGVVKG